MSIQARIVWTTPAGNPAERTIWEMNSIRAIARAQKLTGGQPFTLEARDAEAARYSRPAYTLCYPAA